MTEIQYKYGTSGFRFHYSIIEKISKKIGNVVALLSMHYDSPYGVMITASHNPHLDNGVKIINSKGEMINVHDEKIITDYVNNNNSYYFEKNMNLPQVFIGYDTRKSSPTIFDLIKSGVEQVNECSIIHNMSIVTTPELHYIMYIHDKKCDSYVDNLFNIIKDIKKINITCDCANGVGTNILRKIQSIIGNIELINTNIEDHCLLNQNGGSDYIVNNLRIPCEIEKLNSLYASLDGDADRVVFYYKDDKDFHLLNGDKISALIAKYISVVMNDVSNVAVIHTGYSNKAFLDFIHSLGIHTVCTGTGVKHLHTEALKYDISIYFESNGHGTVLFNKSYPELYNLKKFFHPTIGDGIMDMFAILFILEELSLEIEEWNNFYTDYPYSLLKIEVDNKDDFITTKNELELIKPIKLQKYIYDICKDNVRAFVRPSGTENYLRVYVESENIEFVNSVKDKLMKYIKRNYKIDRFEKNDILFEISDIKYKDYYNNYLYLMKQLTSIDPDKICYDDFCKFIDKLNNNHIIKVIRRTDNNQVIGSITVLIEEKIIHNFGKVAHIEDVVVDKSMRGFGIGQKLLEIAENECNNCYKIILDCSNENVKFYEKCGYEWKGNEMALYL